MNLADRARSVRNRDDFVAFVSILIKDYQEDKGHWSNSDVESYLVAMAAWSEDMDGFYRNSGEDVLTLSPWRILADILAASRVYE